jgi:hypothetical protein
LSTAFSSPGKTTFQDLRAAASCCARCEERLQRLLKPIPAGILYAGHFEPNGELLCKGAVLPLELEGLVAKRKGEVPAERFRTRQ